MHDYTRIADHFIAAVNMQTFVPPLRPSDDVVLKGYSK
jgi:hypothetical protein